MILRKYTVEIWDGKTPTTRIYSDIAYSFSEEEAIRKIQSGLGKGFYEYLVFPLVFKAKSQGNSIGEARDKWDQKVR